MTRWGPHVSQRIDDLRFGKGREDWDGEWPPLAAIDAAWTLACELFRDETPTPSVVPSEDGEVLFIWHKNQVDAEIIVSTGEPQVWVHDRASGEMRSGSAADHRDCCIERLLDRLDGVTDASSVPRPAQS